VLFILEAMDPHPSFGDRRGVWGLSPALVPELFSARKPHRLMAAVASEERDPELSDQAVCGGLYSATDPHQLLPG